MQLSVQYKIDIIVQRLYFYVKIQFYRIKLTYLYIKSLTKKFLCVNYL